MTARSDIDIIELVGSNSILPNWGSVEPHLSRMLDKVDTGYTADDVQKKLIAQQMQLWNIDDWQAIAVTEIQTLPQHQTLTVVFVSGDGMTAWLPSFIRMLKWFAKACSCKYIDAFAREGWIKTAGPLGFNKSYPMLRLTVDG